MVTLTWRSFEYLSLQQDRVYTLTSFIAELGGSIGVWLGLSVLSLFQVHFHFKTYLVLVWSVVCPLFFNFLLKSCQAAIYKAAAILLKLSPPPKKNFFLLAGSDTSTEYFEA